MTSSPPDLRNAVNHISNVMQSLAVAPVPEGPDADSYIRRARESIRGCVLCTDIVGGDYNAIDGGTLRRQMLDGFDADERDKILEARKVMKSEGLNLDAVRLFSNLYQMAGYLGVGTITPESRSDRLHKIVHALALGASTPTETAT